MGQERNADLVGYNGKDSKNSEVVSDDLKFDMEAGRKANKRRTLQVHLVLLALQVGYAGHQVLSRVALTSGLSQFVYSIYRNSIALVLMVPFAYVLEKKDRPPLTLKLLSQFFVLGVTGIVGSQQLFLLGLIYTSAAFAATTQNAIPMFTFLLALMLGVEKVRLGRLDGQAKVVGTIICVGGAVFMSVWKGPAVIQGWDQEDREENDLKMKAILGHTLGTHAIRFGIDTYRLGGICLLLNCMSWAAYFIMLAPILQVCPTPLTITSWLYFFGSIQIAFIMLIFTGGEINWSLEWGPQVFSVVYAGVISSGINFSLQSWAIQRGGPLVVSLYTPLSTIIVGILSVVLLGDSYYLGSLIGGIATVAGLYMVTWGQVEHRRQDALEVAGLVCGDEESAAVIRAVIDPQSPYSSSASGLTHPLLAGTDYDSDSSEQPGHSIPIPASTLKRRPSFYDDELHPGSFTPHYIH
ncbi:unnamed protein product [Calypogeia fissa]